MKPRFPLFLEGIELEVVSVGGGLGEMALDVKPSHMNAVGVLHGGVVFTLVDTCMGLTLSDMLPPEESCVSVEIKVNNVTAVKEGRLVARAHVSHKGRTLAHVEADVRDDRGRLVAKGLGTFFVRTMR